MDYVLETRGQGRLGGTRGGAKGGWRGVEMCSKTTGRRLAPGEGWVWHQRGSLAAGGRWWWGDGGRKKRSREGERFVW